MPFTAVLSALGASMTLPDHWAVVDETATHPFAVARMAWLGAPNTADASVAEEVIVLAEDCATSPGMELESTKDGRVAPETAKRYLTAAAAHYTGFGVGAPRRVATLRAEVSWATGAAGPPLLTLFDPDGQPTALVACVRCLHGAVFSIGVATVAATDRGRGRGASQAPTNGEAQADVNDSSRDVQADSGRDAAFRSLRRFLEQLESSFRVDPQFPLRRATMRMTLACEKLLSSISMPLPTALYYQDGADVASHAPPGSAMWCPWPGEVQCVMSLPASAIRDDGDATTTAEDPSRVRLALLAIPLVTMPHIGTRVVTASPEVYLNDFSEKLLESCLGCGPDGVSAPPVEVSFVQQKRGMMDDDDDDDGHSVAARRIPCLHTTIDDPQQGLGVTGLFLPFSPRLYACWSYPVIALWRRHELPDRAEALADLLRTAAGIHGPAPFAPRVIADTPPPSSSTEGSPNPPHHAASPPSCKLMLHHAAFEEEKDGAVVRGERNGKASTSGGVGGDGSSPRCRSLWLPIDRIWGAEHHLRAAAAASSLDEGTASTVGAEAQLRPLFIRRHMFGPAWCSATRDPVATPSTKDHDRHAAASSHVDDEPSANKKMKIDAETTSFVLLVATFEKEVESCAAWIDDALVSAHPDSVVQHQISSDGLKGTVSLRSEDGTVIRHDAEERRHEGVHTVAAATLLLVPAAAAALHHPVSADANARTEESGSNVANSTLQKAATGPRNAIERAVTIGVSGQSSILVV